MTSFDKLTRSSLFLKLILSFVTLIAIVSFSWFGIHELVAIKDMRHIVNSDFKNLVPQLKNSGDENIGASLQTELQSHLSKTLHASHYSLRSFQSRSLCWHLPGILH